MREISDKTNKSGLRVITVELAPGEQIISFNIGETAKVFQEGGFYKLAEPLDEIVPDYVLSGSIRVYWCPIDQKWLE